MQKALQETTFISMEPPSNLWK